MKIARKKDRREEIRRDERACVRRRLTSGDAPSTGKTLSRARGETDLDDFSFEKEGRKEDGSGEESGTG